ncbi:MAG: isochorismatase family protein [Alphaproteobacteria bacterium]
MDEAKIKDALETVFAADSELYQSRGFQRRIGYGTRPALVNIDLANAWTRPGNAFTCANCDEIIREVNRLLVPARALKIPIVFTTTAYAVTDGPNSDMGMWGKKIPTEVLKVGSEAVEIDSRLAPRADEHIIVKKRASAFHGTMLAGLLRAADVDTVIVTGATASACVRNTVEDALAEGFRPIVPRETIGDRIAGAIEWNLFDIDAKVGDVEPVENVLRYLEGLNGAPR